MDNLTHSLVGVLLSRAGLRKYAPSQSTLLYVLAANAPDLDIVVGFSAPLYLTYHRHLTHSVFAIPVMAAVSVWLAWGLAWLWAKARRRSFARDRFGPAWMGATLVGATHPLLDWTNSYGVRPWLPFSDAWYYGDLFFIIDLAVWAILMAGVLWSAKSRRTGAVVALSLLLAYGAASAALRARAMELLSALEIDGLRARRVAAFPAPPGPLDWAGYVQAGGRGWWVPLSLGADARAEDAVELEAPAEDAPVWRTPLGERYRGFARFPVQMRDADELTLGDARFFRSGSLALACRFSLAPDGSLDEGRFGF